MINKTLVSVLLILAASSGLVHANEPLPKFELGIGVVGLTIPDYRGSSESTTKILPTPYIQYRGDRFKVDEGARGVLFESENLNLTFSGNFTFPADNDTPEREGMESLSATIEVGPSLNYRFAKLSSSAWWLDLPFRLAYTLDSDFDSLGQVFQPRLSWRKPSRYLGDWKLRFNFGPLYASNAFHDYYYSVADSEAIVGRPAYEADGGFSGARVEFTYSKRISDYWVGGFIQYDSLRDSVIDASPLVQKKTAGSPGLRLPGFSTGIGMPELPEVETTLRGIAPYVEGHEAVEFDIRQPRLRWPVDSEIYELSGNRIGQLKRRGKYILMPIADSHLIWHLGMSGSLRICQQDGPRKKHDHIEIFLDSGKSLVYHDPRRFGALLLTHDDPYQHKVIVSLGVEPLSHDFDDDYVFRVSRHKSTPIKSLIMDSHQLVGVGNIYACESLYAAGINPTRAAGSLSRKRLQRLVIEIRKVLNAAITQGGSTLRDFIQADGQPGYFAQSLNVYGNQGNCPGCDKAVKRIQQNQRSTFYCTNCQT